MLNLIWGFMLLVGILCAVVTGNMGAVTNGALESAGEAVSLCITMLGVMALWMGLMEIAKEAGIMERMTKGIAPFLHFLFPGIPADHPSLGYIATNVVANILGLGWACTPAGLKAMEALADLERERGNPQYLEKGRGDCTASPEMCTFLILNISSLELIPVNMIAYRSQYGSSTPARVVAPALVATFISSLIAVLYCKWKNRGREGDSARL